MINDSKQRTAAFDGLEKIALLIRRYASVEKVYLGNGNETLTLDLRETMVKLYKAILEYQATAVCQFRRNTVTQLARNLATVDDWSAIIATIDSTDKACEQFMTVLDSDTQQAYAHRLEEMLKQQDQKIDKLIADSASSQTEIESQHHIEALFNCHRIFRTSDYEGHKARNPDRMPGTCHWLLDHPQYHDWRDSNCSSLLWISGDPGSGKSVLSKYLVDQAFPSASYTTCYFFFRDDSSEQRESKYAICALLHQLFVYKPGLLEHALSAVRENGDKLQQLFLTLWTILLGALSNPSAGRVILILDALDECEESPRNALLTKLRNFYTEQANRSNASTIVKILVTSRPYHNIESQFNDLLRSVPIIRVAGEDETAAIGREIGLVIKAQVQGSASTLDLEPRIRDYLEERLSSMTHHNYLWPILVLEEIRSAYAVTKKQIDTVVDRLPGSIDAAYSAILDHSTDIPLAKRLLHIVLAAKRPLTVLEVNVALYMSENCKSYDDLDIESEPSFRKRLRNLCGLFVSVTDSQVYLFHQTARAFLVSNSSVLHADTQRIPTTVPWKYEFSDEESDLVLGETCMWLLRFTNLPDDDILEDVFGYIDDKPVYDDHGGSNPLLAYAVHYWTAHIGRVKVLPPATLHLATTLCESGMRRIHTWSTGMSLKPLNVASRSRLPSIVRALLESGADVNATDEKGNTAMMAAMSHFEPETAELVEVVDLLLESGVSLDAKDEVGMNALHRAASNGWTSVLRLLLGNGASVHEKDPSGQTALNLAISRAELEVTRLLLVAGSDIRARDDIGSTALDEAILGLFVDGTELLINAGADIEATNEWGRTPLHIACSMYSTMREDWLAEAWMILEMLLQTKPNLETKDGEGSTALDIAREHGSLDLIALLKSAGAVDWEDREGTQGSGPGLADMRSQQHPE